MRHCGSRVPFRICATASHAAQRLRSSNFLERRHSVGKRSCGGQAEPLPLCAACAAGWGASRSPFGARDGLHITSLQHHVACLWCVQAPCVRIEGREADHPSGHTVPADSVGRGHTRRSSSTLSPWSHKSASRGVRNRIQGEDLASCKNREGESEGLAQEGSNVLLNCRELERHLTH